MERRWAGRTIPPIFLLMASGPLPAAEDFETANRPLEHVQVTATRRESTEFEVSAAVSQVEQEQVRAENPDVLAEMLRGLPGTYFQQTTPGQGIPIIRGLKGSQVLHLVDGMRLNNAFFRNAPNQYLGLVDAFATDRVEVVRGASGALYGADAMGGVVNVLTPEPEFEGTEWQRRTSVYSAYNSADDGRVISARMAGGHEGTSLSGGVSLQDRSDRETGSGQTVSPSGYRAESADLKWTMKLGADADLMLAAQVLEQPSTPRVDELVPGFGQDRPSSEQFEFMPNRRSFLHARYRRHRSTGWYEDFELHLARQVITDDRLTQDFGEPLVTSEENESTLDGLTLQFNSTLPGGTLLTWGLEYYTDDVASSRIRLDTSTGQSGPVRSRFPDGSSMDSAALYTSGEWRSDGRLTIDAGLRYSVFDIELPASEDVPAVSLSPDDITGDLHLVYELSPALHVVGNFGRGFRPPNIFDLATLGPRPGNRFNVANPGLGAESVWSYDIGLKSVGERWQAEVFAFYMDYQDKITSVETGEVTPGGRAVVRSENRNQVTLHGVEAGLRWLVDEALELYGVVNYTHGKEQEADGMKVPADRIPPLNGKLGLVYRPDDRLRVEGYVLFAGDQDRLNPRDVRDPRINPLGTPGWGTFNALVSWQARERLQLGLKLENLGDRAYREHGSGIDAPGMNIGVWLNATWP